MRFDEIAEAMNYFASMMASESYRQQGEHFNYESFAKQGFKKEGRGYVMIDVSDFVVAYDHQLMRGSELSHKYVSLSWQKSNPSGDEAESGILSLLESYDPNSQYVVLLTTDCEKLPKSLVESIGKRYILFFYVFDCEKQEVPSKS